MQTSQIKEQQQRVWSTGDFSAVAARMTIVGEQLCESVELHAGERLLDIATGSGNTAIAAARRECIVTGVDYVAPLLERALERSAAEGLEVDWRLGDTELLPCDDAEFDVALSTFGIMFAPEPDRAVSELARVVRPGGRVGMANWTPSGMIGAMLNAVGSVAGRPAGLPSPCLWGDDSTLRQRLSPAFHSVSTTPRNFRFLARSAEQWVCFMRRYYGPLSAAFDRVGDTGHVDLEQAILAAIAPFNQSNGHGDFCGASEYLEATAVRR